MQVWKETLKTIWIKHASSIRPLSGKNIYYPVCSYILYKYSNQFETVLTLQMKCIFMFLCHVDGMPQKGTALCVIAAILATAWDKLKRGTLLTPDKHFKQIEVVHSWGVKKKKNIFQKCLLFPYWFKWQHRHSSMCVLCMNTVYWLV